MNTQSLVNWNYTGSDHTGFLLERSTNSGSGWTSILTCAAVTTSYLDNDLWWGSASWYRATAANAAGFGPTSSTASLFIHSPAMDVPNITASQSGSLFSSHSYLEWDFTGSSQGATSRYDLERSINSGSAWTTTSINASGSTYVQTASWGTGYWYRIRAFADFGLYSQYSNTATIYMVFPPPVLSAVQNGDDEEVFVSWTFDGDYSMSLSRSADSGSTWPFTQSLAPLTLNYTDTAVSFETTYWYKVRQARFPTEPYSNTASVFVESPPPPEAPELDPPESGSSILTWHSQSNDQNWFAVFRSSPDSASYVNYASTIGTVETYTDTNVTASAGTGSSYYYKITAINDYGTSSFSNTGSITFIYDPPEAPELDPPESGSAILTWHSQSNNQISFSVFRSSPDSASYVNYASTIGTVETYTDTEVTSSEEGAPYYYKIVAINSYGTSSFSNTGSIVFTSSSEPVLLSCPDYLESIPFGAAPMPELATAPNGTLFVFDRLTSQYAIIDTATDTIITSSSDNLFDAATYAVDNVTTQSFYGLRVSTVPSASTEIYEYNSVDGALIKWMHLYDNYVNQGIITLREYLVAAIEEGVDTRLIEIDPTTFATRSIIIDVGSNLASSAETEVVEDDATGLHQLYLANIGGLLTVFTSSGSPPTYTQVAQLDNLLGAWPTSPPGFAYNKVTDKVYFASFGSYYEVWEYNPRTFVVDYVYDLSFTTGSGDLDMYASEIACDPVDGRLYVSSNANDEAWFYVFDAVERTFMCSHSISTNNPGYVVQSTGVDPTTRNFYVGARGGASGSVEVYGSASVPSVTCPEYVETIEFTVAIATAAFTELATAPNNRMLVFSKQIHTFVPVADPRWSIYNTSTNALVITGSDVLFHSVTYAVDNVTTQSFYGLQITSVPSASTEIYEYNSVDGTFIKWMHIYDDYLGVAKTLRNYIVIATDLAGDTNLMEIDPTTFATRSFTLDVGNLLATNADTEVAEDDATGLHQIYLAGLLGTLTVFTSSGSPPTYTQVAQLDTSVSGGFTNFPAGFAYNKVTDKVYVSVYGSYIEVWEYNPRTFVVDYVYDMSFITGSGDVDMYASEIACDPVDGRLYVSSNANNEDWFYVFDAVERTFICSHSIADNTFSASVNSLAVEPTTRQLYVGAYHPALGASGSVEVYE